MTWLDLQSFGEDGNGGSETKPNPGGSEAKDTLGGTARARIGF